MIRKTTMEGTSAFWSPTVGGTVDIVALNVIVPHCDGEYMFSVMKDLKSSNLHYRIRN